MKPLSPPRIERSVVRTTSRATHRTLFLSDIHLGTRMCRAESLLAFLAANEAETIYLVGDVVDNWRSLARPWPEAHILVLRHLLNIAQAGTRVVYIPGNHDAFFRAFAGSTFEDIEVRREAIHKAADGSRFLVTHGDQCDLFSHRVPMLARAGSMLEGAFREMDVLQRRACRAAGLSEWTGIERLISGTNAFVRRHDRFEERLCDLARTRGLDGIVCGHFHQPALRTRGGITYANCGDWTEHATAIVEDADGALRMLWIEDAPASRHSVPAGHGDESDTAPELA